MGVKDNIASESGTAVRLSQSSPANRSRDELEAEVARLQKLVRELSYLVHGLAHDLREPIRMMASYTELLRRDTSVEEDPNGKEYIHFLSSSAHRLDALICGMLDYERLLGSETPHYGAVDMNAVVQTALANLQLRIEESGALIASDNLPLVHGDFSQLAELAQNLVGNALKYRKSSEAPEILIRADQRESEWIFSVEDNGIGIDPRFHADLFAPFKRLHSHEVSGAGLGLAICRHIVERHGGRIWVESAPGEGSTFKFSLPAGNDSSS